MALLPSTTRALLVLTLLVTWLVWGSSFLAITFALQGFPPLLLMGSRFVTAGAIVTAAGLVLATRRGEERPSRRAWRDATIVGVGFVTIGMGATGWSATRLPTGTAALLVASAPLWIALLQATLFRERRTRPSTVVGLLCGMAGIAVLVAPGRGGGDLDVAAALVLVAANAAWAGASLFSPRSERPRGLVLPVGMQMLTGGLILVIAALALGEGAALDAGSLGPAAIGGWAYLVFPAAIGGFLSYGWLLTNVGAGVASTHAFVNPLVAVALGAAVLGEQVDARVAVAAAAVVTAVVLLLLGARARGATPAAEGARSSVATVRAGRRATAAALRGASWSPAPTPAWAAARRITRPWQATDGMDALAIDEAFDRPRR